MDTIWNLFIPSLAYKPGQPPFNDIVWSFGFWVLNGVSLSMLAFCSVIFGILMCSRREWARNWGPGLLCIGPCVFFVTQWIFLGVTGHTSTFVATIGSTVFALICLWLLFPGGPAILGLWALMRGTGGVEGVFEGLRLRPYSLTAMSVCLVCAIVAGGVAFDGLCVREYSFGISFWWTRAIREPDPCAHGRVCATLILAADDPTTSFEMTFVVSPEFGEEMAPPVGVVQWKASSGWSGDVRAAVRVWEVNGETRLLYHAVLEGFAAGSEVWVQAMVQRTESVYGNARRVRLLAADRPALVVVGGDIGLSAGAEAMTRQAAMLDPDLVVVAGDLTYANNWAACRRRWDVWLAMWEASMVAADGRAVPLVAGVGNHDAGSHVGWGRVTYYAPLITGTAPGSSPRSYRHVDLPGRATLLVLDSGHVVRAADPDQMRFIDAQLARRRTPVPVYHVPMHSDCSDGPDTPSPTMAWKPAFDAACVPLALEAHAHRYFRLREPQETPHCAAPRIHAGGGAWGPVSAPCPAVHSYVDVTLAKRHVIILHIHLNGTIDAKAIGQDGDTLDTFSVTC